MKKNATIIFVLVSGLLLSGCTNAPDPTKERIVTKDIYTTSDDDQQKVIKAGTMNLLYKANADIPYISLKDGADYINELRHELVDKDYTITLKQEDNKATYTSPDNAEAVFDLSNQTITYNDYSGLLNHISPYKNTYALVSPNKDSSIHLLENNYEKGKAFTINLKDYSQIDIYKHGEDYYLPLTTYNDLFINPTVMVNLIYRFDKLFFLGSDTPFAVENDEGDKVLTELGKAFYDKKDANPTVSKAYAEYYYQNICLNFDYLYGVRGLKGRDYTSFDAYLSSKGYKEDMLSGDVKKMDAAFAYATSYLEDFHTTVGNFSPLYEYDTAEISESKYDQNKVKEEKEGNSFKIYRSITGAEYGFSVDETNRIAYIAFDNFSSVDEKALSKSSWTKEDLANSATLFAYAYKEITTKYLGKIDYVAVDLATNDGGAAEGMAYMLGILLGKVSIELQNPFDGSHAKATYMLDINRDGSVDEKDVSLREYGLQIVFIDTHYAFSCGNALPVLAKVNYPQNVTTIGETTGGGTCAVRAAYTALGSMYHVSGPQMISKRDKDNKLVNIEDGVAADIALDKKLTIVRNEVAKALHGQK